MPHRRPWVASILIGLLVAGWVVAAEELFIPLSERGVAQSAAAFVNGAGHILKLPASLAVDRLPRRGITARVSATVPRSWLLGATSFALYFLGAFATLSVWRALGRPTPSSSVSTSTSPQPPRLEAAPAGRVSRRQVLRTGFGLAAVGVGATGAWSFVVEQRLYEVTRRTIPLRGLPETLRGLRIVQLSDIHHGPWLPRAQVEEVVRRTNELEPDLVFLTGDYVHESPSYIPGVASALSGLSPKIGTLAVLGNHDWWQGAAEIQKAFRERGIPLIDNTRLVLDADRRLLASAERGLLIAGVGDLWEDRCLFAQALGDLPDDMPRVLLSHNPDVAEEPDLVRSGLRVDLIVSGHTHGGQIRIPWVGTPIVPSRFGSRYAQGLVEGPTARVFVSRGIGTTILPLRFGVRPEIPVLELEPTPS